MDDKKYEYGNVLKLEKDTEIKTAFDNIKLIKAGTKLIIGVDGFGHYLTGDVQPLGVDIINDIDGYDTSNISKLIYNKLKYKFYLEEFFEGYDIKEEDFIKEVKFILEEYLGM